MDSNKEPALTTAVEENKQDVANHDTARNEEDDDLSRRVLKVVCRINELIWAQRCKELPEHKAEEFVQHMESVSSATVRAVLKEMLTTLRFDLPADVSHSIDQNEKEAMIELI